MKETLLFIIIVLAIFSIIKVLLLIAYSYVLKPKVDKDGNIIAPKNKKDDKDGNIIAPKNKKDDKDDEKTLNNDDDDDFWNDW
ncbi:hypothetical protein [uncultured Streptococcus sp.]|uniref:hypothetical protein n=1 Tax=uncultured Streptococcus sp. TaxID=83427 RepID=UPI0025E41BC9|nr:hypothetical protein [uncultured Streptococcus sp.]